MGVHSMASGLQHQIPQCGVTDWVIMHVYWRNLTNSPPRITIDSFWPSDTILWQRSGSTLAQVMACCLTAPSHYLNQYWLIISEVWWHLYYGNFKRDAPQPSITKIGLKITYIKFHLNFLGANELKVRKSFRGTFRAVPGTFKNIFR